MGIKWAFKIPTKGCTNHTSSSVSAAIPRTQIPPTDRRTRRKNIELLPLSGWTDLDGITTSNPDCWYRCVYIGCLSACIARSQRTEALGTFRRWPSWHLSSCITNAINSFGVICESLPGGEKWKRVVKSKRQPVFNVSVRIWPDTVNTALNSKCKLFEHHKMFSAKFREESNGENKVKTCSGWLRCDILSYFPCTAGKHWMGVKEKQIKNS